MRTNSVTLALLWHCSQYQSGRPNLCSTIPSSLGSSLGRKEQWENAAALWKEGGSERGGATNWFSRWMRLVLHSGREERRRRLLSDSDRQTTPSNFCEPNNVRWESATPLSVWQDTAEHPGMEKVCSRALIQRTLAWHPTSYFIDSSESVAALTKANCKSKNSVSWASLPVSVLCCCGWCFWG